MLRVTAGHDIEYPLRSAGSAVAYYLQDGKEPPGVWAGTAAGALGLTGQVDPETYRALFGKLIAPTGVPDKTTRDALRRLSDWLGQGDDEPGPRGTGEDQEDGTSGQPGPRDSS
jgi:hypothetical protein